MLMYTLTYLCMSMCVIVSSCLFVCSMVCRGKQEDTRKRQQYQVWFVLVDRVGDVWRCYDDGHARVRVEDEHGFSGLADCLSDDPENPCLPKL